jgi:predicted pyridoxine 5'-phosphate oxidase superfamily flavin-nucleotide-binding protein
MINQRRQNDDGEWVDAEPTRHVVRAFRTLAENVVESLARRDRVFVHSTVPDTASQSFESVSEDHVPAVQRGYSLSSRTVRTPWRAVERMPGESRREIQ